MPVLGSVPQEARNRSGCWRRAFWPVSSSKETPISAFSKNAAGGYDESISWAGLFDSGWRLGVSKKPKPAAGESKGDAGN